VADAVTRSCSECGAPTKAFALTLGKVTPGGRKVQKQVALGGKRCDDCEAKRHKAELVALAEVKLSEYSQYACIPRHYRGIDYSGFTAGKAVEAAQAWARGELRGLCLTGDVGIGKSWLAAAAIADMIRRRAAEDAGADLDEAHEDTPRRFRPVRWVSVSNLMADLRRSFSDEDRARATKIVAGNGAIVLDDLDKVNPTDFGKEIVFSTLDARTASGAQVLVTTNLAPGELGKKLGKAVMSRIAGECLVVQMVGPDRRVRPTAELRAA
jgi:DNA replication protein DnaC